jgi:hypothetical protein
MSRNCLNDGDAHRFPSSTLHPPSLSFLLIVVVVVVVVVAPPPFPLSPFHSAVFPSTRVSITSLI